MVSSGHFQKVHEGNKGKAGFQMTSTKQNNKTKDSKAMSCFHKHPALGKVAGMGGVIDLTPNLDRQED